jgi:hypothetical protein
MAASTFLRCFILGVGLPMSQMQAQAGRAIAVARDPITTIEAERLKTSVDLIAGDVGLSGLGEIVFTLENRGDVNINEGGKHTNPPKKTISTPPIRIDLYLGGALVQSVYQASLGGDQSHAFAVKPLSNVPNCKDVRAIKIVVDPANVVPELHDDVPGVGYRCKLLSGTDRLARDGPDARDSRSGPGRDVRFPTRWGPGVIHQHVGEDLPGYKSSHRRAGRDQQPGGQEVVALPVLASGSPGW